jgi:hypothetical protein
MKSRSRILFPLLLATISNAVFAARIRAQGVTPSSHGINNSNNPTGADKTQTIAK